MKASSTPLSLIAFMLSATFVRAGSTTDASLANLQAERARRIAAAIAPIDRQYRAALDQLLRATMQRGDLDGALKIKAALDLAAPTSAGASPAPASSGTPLASLGNPTGARRFAGTKWLRGTLFYGFGPDGAFQSRWGREIYPDGKWHAVSATTAEITYSDGTKGIFTWTKDGMTDDKNRSFAPFPGAEAAPSTSPPATPSAPASSSDSFGKSRP